MRGLGLHRPLIGLVTLALLVTGLLGALRYWESYYQHRGFVTVAYLPHARKGRHLTVQLYSAALHRQADYLALLPPGYDPAHHRYPVYYLLHGSPGRPQVYYAIASLNVRLSNLLSQHRMQPMILIYPDGRIGGSTFSDSEWANTPSGNYESYVIEVVRDVDRRFATIANRQGRVIGGFSAGGYGATNITLHNLSVFGNLQSWSGYFVQHRSGVFSGASPATLAYNSPLRYVRELGPELANYPLHAFLFTGRDDDVSPQLAPMANALAADGAQVSYALYHGGHDWQLWHAHLNQLLIFASQDASEPLSLGTGKATTLTPGVVPIPRGAGRRRHGLGPIVPSGLIGPRRAHGSPLPLLRPGHRLTRRPPGLLGRRHHRRHPGLRARRRHRRAPRSLSRRPHRSFIVYRLASTGSATLLGAEPRPDRRAGRPGHAGRARRSGIGLSELMIGLLLALGSAALINFGFLLQHRGLGGRSPNGLGSTVRGALRNRTWLAGQAIGWVGFAGQIAAVAIAPLSLVQAFAAGGLALSVPLAARIFSHRFTRRQLIAVLLIAVSLGALPIGFSTAADHLHAGSLVATVAVSLLAALGVSAIRAAAVRAIAAGLFYGIADAGIKAVSVGWRVHGSSALLSGWTVLAAACTFAGFLAFQSALSDEGAISPISLMTAFAALAALACGLIAFDESLGTSPLAVTAHLVAIAIVLGCVPVLAAAQAAVADEAEAADGRPAAPTSSLRPEYGPG